MTVMMTMMSLGTLLQWLTAECKKADIKLETEFHPQFHPALIVSGGYYPYPMGITHPNPIPLIATRCHILLRRVISSDRSSCSRPITTFSHNLLTLLKISL